jgi:hypothetical protein
MDAGMFWNRVSAYNEALWPVHIIMTVAAAFLTVRVFTKPGPRTDVRMKVFLSYAFAWNGIVFFLLFVRNPISMAIGAPLFLTISILFAVDSFARSTEFRLPRAKWRRVLTFLWLALVALYPLIGWVFLGHAYPSILLPMFPCPLTVFAIALIAAAAPKADKKVFVALLPWALLGLPKCFGALDCYEDCVLFVSGLYGLIVLITNWKARSVNKQYGTI